MSENSLIQFEQLPVIVGNAPEILRVNTNRVTNAVNYGQTLLDTIEGQDMTAELDSDCNKFMANIAKTVDRMNTDRAPITKLLTALGKEFTTIEGKLDKSKDGTIPFKIQQARNKYAATIAAEQRKQEIILRNKQLADAERIEIIAKVELRVRERCNEVMFACKKKYNDTFNILTLANHKEVTAELKAMPVDYTRDKFNEISVSVTCLYIQSTELPGLIFDTKSKLFDELSANFRENMEAHKMSLLDQVPARMQELERIDKSGKEEAKQISAQAEIRRKEEELRLEKENQARELEAAEKAKLTTDIGSAQLSFEKDMAQAEIIGLQTAATKESYVINVHSAAGWGQIVALWLKEFSNKTTLDKFEKKTLGAMKKDLEVLAYNGGAKLDNSGPLEYIADIKALTKR